LGINRDGGRDVHYFEMGPPKIRPKIKATSRIENATHQISSGFPSNLCWSWGKSCLYHRHHQEARKVQEQRKEGCDPMSYRRQVVEEKRLKKLLESSWAFRGHAYLYSLQVSSAVGPLSSPIGSYKSSNFDRKYPKMLGYDKKFRKSSAKVLEQLKNAADDLIYIPRGHVTPRCG